MSSYTREAVEALVPTIWDRQYAWGMVNERQAEADMPKSPTDKKAQNSLWAPLADIRIAWKRADIPLPERRALLLVGGLGLHQKPAAIFEDVSQQAMSQRFERGVGRLCDFLNGTDYQNESEPEEIEL